MYSQGLFVRYDGHTGMWRPTDVENFMESPSGTRHEHAAFALHSPISSEIRVDGPRRRVDPTASRTPGDPVMKAKRLRRADTTITKLARAAVLAATVLLLPAAARAGD